MNSPKRVFIIEDSALIRERLTTVVNAMSGCTVVGHAESEAEAVASIDRLLPDLIVADIQLKEGSGLNVLRHIRRQDYAARPTVVMLTNHASSEYYDRSIDAGADAVFDKTSQYGRFLDFVGHVR